MELSDLIIESVVERYTREKRRFNTLKEMIEEKCEKLIGTLDIKATIQSRVKSKESLRQKLLRYKADPLKKDRYQNESEILEKMADLAGVRIATYLESDRGRVVEEIRRVFAGRNGDAVEIETKDKGFYRATHCQVGLSDLNEGTEDLRGLGCEIQVCSLLGHVWNEVEHDLVYKQLLGEVSSEEKEILDVFGNHKTAGDGLIKLLFAATEKRLDASNSEFADIHDFSVKIKIKFPKLVNFDSDSDQLFVELQNEGINSLFKLEQELLKENFLTRSDSLFDNLQKELRDSLDDAVVLDEFSSDKLLLLLLERRVDSILLRHPLGRGQGGPSRLVSIAIRFDRMQKKLKGSNSNK